VTKFVDGLCSPEQVRQYVDIPFNALAVATKQDVLRLKEWEREIWIPAVVACARRYLPELLKRTDKPELVMLAAAAGTYAIRVAIEWPREEHKPEPPSPEMASSKPNGPATTPAAGLTLESQALSVS
jgi:hypothetical protein